MDICDMNNGAAPSFKIGIRVSNDAMATEKVCELHFLDAIFNKEHVNWFTGEVTEDSLLAEVMGAVKNAKPNKIVQYIDSWGGSAPVGLGLYNYLKGHQAKVETVILNNCASIASVMAMAGNKGKISMPVHGMMVIHKAMTSASGNADELRDAADVADKYTNTICEIYALNNRKGKTKDEIMAMMADGDCWMTGQEAMDNGFVDHVYNDAKVTITNSIAEAKKYSNNIPQRILDMAAAERTNVHNNMEPEVTTTVPVTAAGFDTDKIVKDFTDSLPENGVIGQGENTINILDVLSAPLTALVAGVKTGIVNTITEVTTAVTNSVTEARNAVEIKYKDIVDALTAKVDGFQAVIDSLQTTVTNQATTITAQAEIIATQNQTVATQATAIVESDKLVTAHTKAIKDLTADMTTLMGRPAPAAGSDEAQRSGNDARPANTFRNRTVAASVGD